MFRSRERERDELKLSLADFEKQLASAKRELHNLSMKGFIYSEETCMTKSEHAKMLRKREEELKAQMKAQLITGNAYLMNLSLVCHLKKCQSQVGLEQTRKVVRY